MADLFDDPETIGILGMASGMLGASGPSRMPVSLGQAMGAGLQRGILDRSQAEQVATQKMLREQQMQKLRADEQRKKVMDFYVMQYASSRPTHEQASIMAAYQMNPEAVGTAIVKQLFPEDEKRKPQAIGARGLAVPDPNAPGGYTQMFGDNTIDPPETRTINKKDREVTQEWDAKTGTWRDVGDAPRWNPKPPSTTIQMKPPVGYRYTQDGSSLEAIPGGPADTKIRGAYNADTALRDATTASLDLLDESIQQLLAKPGAPRIFGMPGVLPNMPGGAAADAEAVLNTIKTQLSLKAINDMRAASKTGGAVGQVTEKEWPRLESAVRSLEKSQSRASAQKAMSDIRRIIQESKERIDSAYNMKYGDRATPEQVPGAPTAEQPRRKKYNPQTGKLE